MEQKTNRQLCTANGEYLKVLSVVDLKTTLENKKEVLQFFVIQDKLKYVILGRTGLNTLWPSWRNTFQVCDEKILDNNILEINYSHNRLKAEIVVKYKDVYDNNVQVPVMNYEVQVRLTQNTTPIFRKAYRVPCSLEEKVKTALLELQELNILEPISYSE